MPGSTLAIDVFADGSSDSVYFTGASTLSRALLDIDTGVTLALDGNPTNTTYTIANFDGAGSFTGTFDTVTLSGNPLTEGVDYNITYNAHAPFDPGTGSIEIELLTVPEPGTYALIAGLASLVLMVRRRRAS